MDLHALRTPFVIVGGVATALYMPQRLTLDVDLLVLPSDAPRLHEELVQTGGTRLGTLAFGGTSWEFSDGRLAVLESAEPWAQAALRAPNQSPTGLPVIALPYLVLMRLKSSRLQDLADITRMLGLADEPSREQVRDVVRTYQPDALEDLESMIALGALELESPEREPDG